MEEDDEIHSQSQSPSPPSSPHQNGRLLSTLPSQPVTVAAAPPQHTLTLALPIQQPRQTSGGGGGGGSGGGGGREDCWSDGATSTLIDAWGERYLELSRGNLKQKHWQDVADIVSSREDYRKPPKTDVQCKNRIDTLKKKYKVEKGKIVSGQGPSQWIFFHRLDRLIGANTKITAGIANMANMAAAAAAGGVTTPVVASKVPVAIPVGVRNYGTKPQQQWQQQHKMQQQQLLQEQQRKHPHPHPPPQPTAQFRRPGSMELESNSFGSEEEASPESSDSLPPDTQKRPRMDRQMNSEPPNKGKESGWGNSIRELTQAILDFGESYERAETSKLQQVVEMEKQRMGFAKELELQRMHFFMKTQLELTQLKHGRRVGSSHHRHHHHNSNNRNNSD